MPELATPAGSGEHKAHLVLIDSADGLMLTAQEHYLGIDAVSWFVNKEASWFRDRMAVGTLSITLAAGEERYEVGLGTYELRTGATVAPIFDRPILPERVFRGGTITFRAMLSGLARDTKLGRLIKSTSAAALSVVSGIVQTAALTGPYAPLSVAGGTLVGGIRDIMDTQEEKMRIFDPSGFEVTLRPMQIVGRETYLLLHRGARIDGTKLAISRTEPAPSLTYDGRPFRDGAWVLLRLRRESQYPIEREWFQGFRQWRSDMAGLVDDIQNGVIPRETAMTILRPGTEAAPTAYDRYRSLRHQIHNDGVLTQAEAADYAFTLGEYRRLVVTAIQTGKYDDFEQGLRALRSCITEGRAPDIASLRAIRTEFHVAGQMRPPVTEPSHFGTTGLARRTEEFDPFDTMRGLPRLLEAAFK